LEDFFDPLRIVTIKETLMEVRAVAREEILLGKYGWLIVITISFNFLSLEDIDT